MAKTFTVAAILALPLLGWCAPTSPVSPLVKRLEDGVDCYTGTVDVPEGMIYCIDSEGYALGCDDCNSASASKG